MRLETFFEQFFDAPNAVAKMRELVLQLAAQGNWLEAQLAASRAAAVSLMEAVVAELIVQEQFMPKPPSFL
mgnify:CR=1 FL=1